VKEPAIQKRRKGRPKGALNKPRSHHADNSALCEPSQFERVEAEGGGNYGDQSGQQAVTTIGQNIPNMGPPRSTVIVVSV
jgi:hypothetical protein